MLTQTIKRTTGTQVLYVHEFTKLRALPAYVPTCLCILCAYGSNVFYLPACLCLFHANVPMCVHVLRSCVCRWFTCLCTFIQLCAYTWQLCAFERQDTKIHLENMVSMSMLVGSEDEIINTDCHFYLQYQNSMNLIPKCKSTSNLLKVCI